MRDAAMKKKLKIFKYQAGFTMMELMIALAIIAGSAAVCLFSVQPVLQGIRFKEAARNIKSDMTLAKLNAIRTGSFVTIQFDLANERYTVFNDDGGGNDDNAGNLVQDDGETTVKTVTLPDGVDIIASGFGVNDHARFNQIGQAWGAGSVVISRGGGANAAEFLRVRTTLIGNLSIQTSEDGNDPWTDLNPPKSPSS
jgi:prepilin-type N-terminal cleavage/methylation domain-containing protein